MVIIYTPLDKFFHTTGPSVFEWTLLISAVLIAVGLAKVITYLIDKNVPLSEKDY